MMWGFFFYILCGVHNICGSFMGKFSFFVCVLCSNAVVATDRWVYLGEVDLYGIGIRFKGIHFCFLVNMVLLH